MKKVKVSPLIIPASVVLANLLAFLMNLVLLTLVVLFTGYGTVRLFLLIPAVLIHVLLVTGLSILFACLNAFFRDIKYVVEILLMIWFYATPVFYVFEMTRGLPAVFRVLIQFNPFTGIVCLFRGALLSGEYLEVLNPVHFLLVAIILIISTAVYFHLNKRVVDVI